MSTSIRLKQSSAWVALLALASAAASSNPNDTDELHSMKVDYADLNVHTLAGAAVLYHRIERAAREVCGPDNELSAPGFSRHGQWKSCRQMAIAAAVAKVNSPWLTAIHDSKTGGPKLASLRSPRYRAS
jgi:UrcA family protein